RSPFAASRQKTWSSIGKYWAVLRTDRGCGECRGSSSSAVKTACAVRPPRRSSRDTRAWKRSVRGRIRMRRLQSPPNSSTGPT
ncbi:MAG: six-cysteine peptide SCIFF, partial [Woeseiaceae bacterium]|nr:six-cysteine peptide SCIFF [Woeseiaceae bacterium]